MSWKTCSRTIQGWQGACLTATAVIELFVLFLVALAGVNGFAVLSAWDFVWAILIGVPVILVLVSLLSSIPSVLAIWLSERLCIRSPLFFVLAGGLIGAGTQSALFRSFNGLSSLFVVAGCLAGLDYWHTAGRYAGEERGRSGP